MSFSKVWPSGLVDGLSSLDAAQLMSLDTDHANSIDGLNGGAYAPVVEIDIGQKGLGRTLPATASAYGWDIFANDTALDGTVAARTMWRARSCAHGAAFAAAWTIVIASLIRHVLKGAATTDLVTIPINDLLEQGQTLVELDVVIAIATGHSALPQFLPAFSVLRYALNGTNSSIGSFTMAPGSVAVYENGGALQTVTITGMTEVVDKTQYVYALGIADENGTNSQSGNRFFDMLAKGHITSFQPF